MENKIVEVVHLMETLKGHYSQVARTVAHSTNMINTFAEENSQYHKVYDDILDSLDDKTDDILSSLQSLHEQMIEMQNDTMSKCLHSNMISSTEDADNTFHTFEELFNINSTGTEILENSENDEVDPEQINNNDDILRIFTELEHDHSESKAYKDIKSLEISHKSVNKTNQLGNLTSTLDSTKKYSDKEDEIKQLASLHTTNITNSSATIPVLVYRNSNIKYDQLNATKVTDFQEKISSSLETITTGFEKHLSNTESKEEDIARRLMLLFIKVLKGHLSKEIFLREANPEKPFITIDELIKSIKGNKYVANEFLQYLESWQKYEAD